MVELEVVVDVVTVAAVDVMIFATGRKIFLENGSNCCGVIQNRRAVSINESLMAVTKVNILERIVVMVSYSFGMIPSTELSK